MTLEFEIWSSKETYILPGYVLNFCIENKTDYTNGLRGVSKQTDIKPYAINYIDCIYQDVNVFSQNRTMTLEKYAGMYSY